jgi:putative transposase
VSLVGPGGLLAGVTKTVLQSALDAEMADHLGHAGGERPPFPSGNHRNGTWPKTVLTEVGPIPLEVSRHRNGKFEAAQPWPRHSTDAARPILAGLVTDVVRTRPSGRPGRPA